MALSCGSKVVKYLLFFFNLLVWGCGVALLGIGIWLFTAHSSASYYAHIADLDFGLIKASAITLCVVGALVFIVAGLGCWGACNENTGCLSAFSVLLIILLVLQLVAVILAGALHSQIRSDLQGAMNQTLVKYYGQSGDMNQLITESWNFMQMGMPCCGIVKNGPKDYIYTEWWKNNRTTTEYNQTVPDSCCVSLFNPNNYSYPVAKDPQNCYQAAFDSKMPDRQKYAYYTGCEQKLNDWFMSSLAVLITGVVILIIIQITVLVMACCLRSNIRDSYETI